MIHSEKEKKKVASLILMDIEKLYARIKYKEFEYIQIFSQKRTREPFKDIFKSKYDSVTLGDLKLLGDETIVAVEQFYAKVWEMKWYVDYTEEMPQTVEVKVSKFVKDMQSLHDTAQLFLKIDLGYSDSELTQLNSGES